MTFEFGYLPDPPKETGEGADWNATKMLSTLGAATAPKASIKDKVMSVLQQGPIGSCVSNAGFQAIRIKSQQEIGSRLWGYYLARSYHGMEEWDTGTHIRSFFRAMNKYGFMKESEYKYGYKVSYFSKPPPALSYHRAFDQREPTHYWRIFSRGEERLQEIKQAISLGHPVVFGTRVVESFLVWKEHDLPIPRPQPDETVVGGHAMCIIGYDEEGFEFVNSWGTRWGNNGYGKLSNSYMAWDDTRDLWVVEAAPTYSEAT